MRCFQTLRLLAAGSLITAGAGAAGPSTTLAHLANTSISAIKVDATGNIYVTGFQGVAGNSTTYDAFVAKLSPDGSKILYSTKFAGSASDYAVALDSDSAGAAYIFGTTSSADFPVTPGTLQSTAPPNAVSGFVAKVDVQGKVVYATLLGGSGNVRSWPGGLVVNAAGEAIVSGTGGMFPSTPGAPFVSTNPNPFFVLKLDATGSQLLAFVRGVGGRLASDDQGSIYIAGLESGALTVPVTPGAFQATHRGNLCGGTGQVAAGCSYQYVTKLNASLTQIVYSTYVTGSWGASPAAIFVDEQRNVLLAGTTNSPDYPTFGNAYQPVYVANALTPLGNACLGGCIFPPPASGYSTRLNATGTGLISSTFLSGTQSDTIDFAAVTSVGVYLSGQARSPDFPGLAGIAPQCLPQTFETHLSPDGSEVAGARILNGNVLAYDAFTGALLAWTGTDLISFDPTAPPSAITCITDSADLLPVTAVAPGELLSIFGPHFVNADAEQAGVPFKTNVAGVTIILNGTASPLLYVSPRQINFQAPYEIANDAQVEVILKSSDTNQSDSRMLLVTARNPVVFLDTVTPPDSINFATCSLLGPFYQQGTLPLAFNGDGSRNTCSTPAKSGSVVRIFLAGLGVTDSSAITGSITPISAPPLNLPITFGTGSTVTVVSAGAVPGVISGVFQVDVRLPATASGAIPVSLSVGTVPVRDMNLTIWAR